MSQDARTLPGEQLRLAMRRWITGVSIVTSKTEIGRAHGMTVNSFVSLSIDPPLVSVSLAKNTRTHALVEDSGFFGVSVLSQDQSALSDVFAGRVPDGGERFNRVSTFTLLGKAPLITGSLAALECRVVHSYAMDRSTLFIGEVWAAMSREDGEPLAYYNRAYRQLGG